MTAITKNRPFFSREYPVEFKDCFFFYLIRMLGKLSPIFFSITQRNTHLLLTYIWMKTFVTIIHYKNYLPRTVYKKLFSPAVVFTIQIFKLDQQVYCLVISSLKNSVTSLHRNQLLHRSTKTKLLVYVFWYKREILISNINLFYLINVVII